MERKYLVSLDTGGIHNYIFANNKLREIRGASILLDKLNRTDSVENLKYVGVENKDWELVLAGGGNIKVLFADKTKAGQYKKNLEDLFYENASGVDITVILSERKESENEKDWIYRSERELQIKKSFKESKSQILSSGYFKTCESCGLEPAAQEDKEKRFICHKCNQKIKESSNYQYMEIYKRLLKDIQSKSYDLPKDFNEIGKNSEGYIGFIYADGNRIGEALEKINSFDVLKEFSKDIEEATLKATIQSIKKNFKDKYPFQIIIAGGDDLIIATPANKAMDVAIEFCKCFNEEIKKHNVTTSVAVIICHDSFPIRNILEVAEGLLKNAKLKSRKNDGGCFIDFISITGSALEDPILRRKKELEYNEHGIHTLTMRPYSIDRLEKLINSIELLKESDFPKNKLNALYGSLFKGHCQSEFEASFIKTRLSEIHCEVINNIIKEFGICDFPWKKTDENIYETLFADFVELYEFIPQ